MTIGMILFSGKPFPKDIRVEKECMALHKAGYKIIILTQLFPGQKTWEEQPLYDIVRVPLKKRIFSDPLSFFTLQYKQHKKYISRFINDYKPDVLHVHDFDLVPSTVEVNHSRIPVVADLHENGPASFVAFRAYDPPIKRLIRAMLYNYTIWKRKEKKYLPQCQRIITVVPEAAERVEKYGIDTHKIGLVSNTESLETFNPLVADISPNLCNRYKDSWVISYIGGIGPHRGIDTVIKAIPKVSGRIPNLLFLIIGAQDSEVQMIQGWAKKANVSNAVEVIKWLPFEEIQSYLRVSQLTLVPHNDFEHTQSTVPHKLFQYMISEIPVLVSDCRPLKRIVEDGNLGYVFKANDPESLAHQLCHIHANPLEAKERAHKAKEASLGAYSWNNDAKRLIDLYKNF